MDSTPKNNFVNSGQLSILSVKLVFLSNNPMANSCCSFNSLSMLLYIENTILKSFSGFLTELKQLNTLNVPTHDRRHQQRVKELVGQAAGLVKELEQALSNYHTYTEQRTRVYPVDADVDPLSDTNKRLCQHLLENAGHLRPIEQAFRAFHDSLRDDALTTLVRLAIGHVFSIFFITYNFSSHKKW